MSFLFERTVFENSNLDTLIVDIFDLGVDISRNSICSGNHSSLLNGSHAIFDTRDFSPRLET